MEHLTSGTLAGAGSFRCEDCGYVLTASSTDQLPACPSCGGSHYARASLYAAGRFTRREDAEPSADERDAFVAAARSLIAEPGRYLAFGTGDDVRLVPLVGERLRIGRSLASDLRFDDATVSRRHALLVRQPDGVRVLDDRSLNGVFVNGERVEWRVLRDEDEIVVGRHRLRYLEHAADRVGAPGA